MQAQLRVDSLSCAILDHAPSAFQTDNSSSYQSIQYEATHHRAGHYPGQEWASLSMESDRDLSTVASHGTGSLGVGSE